ncbi:MAG: phage tail tube protein [Lachnospiraceae bacterium]|nr:phage tail tube protein [Lachnospiraceae bacterium]
MADPSFNLKTGADAPMYYAREVTQKGADKDKIKTSDGVYNYPTLTRQTGNSIRGTTESIESNELRKGRTRSAPRKGNSSAEGSLDFELSPQTYDDFFEAALRGEWTQWDGDFNTTNEALKEAITKSNLQFVAGDKCIATRCAHTIDEQKGVGFGRKLLIGNGDTGYIEASKSWSDSDTSKGLFKVPANPVIHELNCGTKDIKYMLLREFGGVEGEDLYQKFEHMAVSSISNDISVGSIITGSVGFMGANDPKMLDTENIVGEFDAKGYAGTKGEDTSMFVDGVTNGKTLIANLPKTATQTDQFTAREGFLYLNGKNIEFANAMDWNLDNGLERNFAIFVRNAISTSPLSLDITGNITTYLIQGHSDDIYNAAVDDFDNEIMWCITDNEDDPKYLYIFQIFKAKFTDHDASVNGADVLNISFPFQSFGEMAIRVLRITSADVASNYIKDVSLSGNTLSVTADTDLADAGDITVSLSGSTGGVTAGAGVLQADNKTVNFTLTGIEAGEHINVVAKLGDTTYTAGFIGPVTFSDASLSGNKVTLTSDSVEKLDPALLSVVISAPTGVTVGSVAVDSTDKTKLVVTLNGYTTGDISGTASYNGGSSYSISIS